jgi:RHS repeat-associated protein
VVGRRAEYAILGSSTSIPAEEDWKLEDRAEILAADGLPGAVTFVWDPISDTLVAVFGSDGTPLRQIIQGGNGYDDPIEVAVGENGAVHRLYPVFEEAGAGTLQIILNQAGEVVSRTVQEGAYGEDEVGLAGAAVERIEVTPSRNASGELTSVAVKIRISESIDPATVAAGARLETIAAGGSVVRSWPAAPTLFDNFTLGWTLTASEWSELTATGPVDSTGDPATTPRELAISVTATLRTTAWSQENGILPPPDWALATRPIHTSRHPFEYREPLAVLTTSLQTTGEALLFEAPALSSLAGQTTPATRFIVASGFQALPFSEPATGLVYARARWYDPGTGTFLTPDPLGYVDSSNLYAFAGGDPVNRRDPTGETSLGELVHGFTEDAFAEDGNWLKKTLAVAGEVAYAAVEAASVGAVGKIDRAQEDLDRGKISRSQYWGRTGVAVTQTAVSYVGGAGGGVVGGRVAARALGERGVTALGVRAVGAAGGATGAVTGQVASDAVGNVAGTQQGLSSGRQYALGAASGGVLGSLSAIPARTTRDLRVNPAAPVNRGIKRVKVGRRSHNQRAQAHIREARQAGATDIRANQQQVAAAVNGAPVGQRVGINRPDVQYTNAAGRRVYVEIDAPPASRAVDHALRLLANDPAGIVYLWTLP